MKQLLILSGKGGTGKTTVAGAFVKLIGTKTYADCDVDAPNLHLILKPKAEPQTEEFFGLPIAYINSERCKKCGLCLANCRFKAITHDAIAVSVNQYACEGCGVCAAICPTKAITLNPDSAGKMMLYKKNDSVFSTAQLHTGKGTSGMLVSEVKKRMQNAAAPDTDIAVIDGSPGIGCPVIASLSGVDIALIVTEPSVSGISDMERIIKTARHFSVKVSVCFNKHDTNIENTQKIKQYCKKENIAFAGVIPYDPQAVKSINSGANITDVDCPSGHAVREIFRNTIRIMNGYED